MVGFRLCMSVSALGGPYGAASLGLIYFPSFVEGWKDLMRYSLAVTSSRSTPASLCAELEFFPPLHPRIHLGSSVGL
ncbi:hypothetical protein MUG91_G9n142 [Manis pentadactyla]|nr:hypothetical protein MUG91_G9n142 [Manis pentadactyla]